MMPIRLRDFIEDTDGWLYAVSSYDNARSVGCILRYVPDDTGERADASERRYKKYDFDDAYEFITRNKPRYAGLLHHVPHEDIKRVLKPEIELPHIARRYPRVRKLLDILTLPRGSIGCTGSLLCGLASEASDIDLVVYGNDWFTAQALVREGIGKGIIEGLSDDMWRKVYTKRKPEISFEDFVIHERRKWNRGQIEGTYFDILYTRPYDLLECAPSGRGEVIGRMTIDAEVTDTSLAFDNPAVYEVEHETITRVLSFTHTYSGQALAGETIEACGICERHGSECWLIVGTTREARGEYIVSRTLLEK
jgi:predicted nucleotidyltransferase